MTIENVGTTFQEDLFLMSRTKAWQLCHLAANQVMPGMKESDLQEKLQALAKEMGNERWWHPIKIRFGRNTLCSFRDHSDESIILKSDDLFFLDIGPVFKSHEGDVGQTFKFIAGECDPSFKNPAEEIFNVLKLLWKEQGLSGHALYENACELAAARELEFNLKMAGHRLSDFPHALHHKGSLKEFEAAPTSQRWVLEVHLLDKSRELGYFYEDILI